MKITVEQVHFTYGEKQILRGIDLEIQSGEIFVLLGPNGCGKTTLLKNISGLLGDKREKGVIYLDTKNLSQLKTRELAKILAAVEQHIQVDFDFSVREIIAMGRMPYLHRFQGLQKADQEVIDKVVALTSVEELLERSILTLSSGERQRVWLAMALAQEPGILILDEPTSHLDIRYQVELLELVDKLSKEESLTIAMSLHDMNLAGLFADRIALVKKGQIVYLGTPNEVLNASSIGDVFEIKVKVLRDTETNCFLGVLPLRRGKS